MKKYLPFFRGNGYKFILAPLLKMSEATLELIVPLIIADMIDNGIANSDKSYIIRMFIRLLILGISGMAVSITAQYFAASAAVNFVKKLRHTVYENIQNMSFSGFDKSGSSTLITRMTSDMDSIQSGINLTLRLLLRSPFVVIGACVMAFTVDAKAAVSFAVAVPLLSIVVAAVLFLTLPLYAKIRSALDSLLTLTRENVTGARVIRAFNIEEKQIDLFEKQNGFLTSLQEKTGRISSLLNPVTCIIINASVSLLIFLGAKRVDMGAISCGAVVALYNYMSQILVELIKLADLTVTLTKSVACAKRVSPLLEKEQAEKKTCEYKQSENYIEFDGVSFAYPGAGGLSLENVSFTVKKGERIGIIGSTGSGKSTLLKLLAGFYSPTSGSIFLNGKNIENIAPEELRSRIAFTEQKPVIFRGTVRENLTVGSENLTDERLISALKNACAYEFVSQKDGFLDAVAEQNGSNFSGGQRQRLAVARALSKQAEILILDDASSALDYLTDKMMREAISALDYSAVFTVSQRTGSVSDCDKIILLEDGKATVGTHSELLETSETYREIHFSQFEKEDEAV